MAIRSIPGGHIKLPDNVRIYGGTGAGHAAVGDGSIRHNGSRWVVDGPVEFSDGMALGSRRVVAEDFEGVASGALPAYLTEDLHASGTGDYVTGGEGLYRVALTATDAAEAAQILGHEVDVTKGPVLTARFRVDGLPLDATGGERLVVGITGTHATAEASLDDVGVHAWFRIEGAALDLLYESDDGTTDDDDNDSGVNLADDTFVEVGIDLTTLGAVVFSVNGTAVGTTDMTDATGILRFIACIQRDDNSGTEATRDLEVDYYQIVASR